MSCRPYVAFPWKTFSCLREQCNNMQYVLYVHFHLLFTQGKKGMIPTANPSENLNTRPLVRKQVDFLADKLIFQQLAWMGN